MTYTIFDGRFTIKIKDTKIVAITCEVEYRVAEVVNGFGDLRCGNSRKGRQSVTVEESRRREKS